MRSRYRAYVLPDADHLLASWHPDTRPTVLELDPPGLEWLGLEVKRHWDAGPDRAGVEFVAPCRVGGGKAVRRHERSHFARAGGRWYCLDAEG